VDIATNARCQELTSYCGEVQFIIP
jgi:hypothetical protein